MAYRPQVLPEIGGGTSEKTYVKGDLLYASANDTLDRLGIGVAGDSVNTVNGVPAWANSGSTSPRNLGIKYTSATGMFEICSASGAALSATNPAYVYLHSTTTPGAINRYVVTANQQFIDDVAASDIAGNSFQTGSCLWGAPMPFYIYAAQKSDETACTFAICRLPHLVKCPAAAKCAKTASAVADVQYAFFFLGNPTVADYAGMNCVCVGSIMMTKTTAAHDWTVSAIEAYDGIGKFKEGFWAYQPLSTNGCGATLPPVNSLFLDTGGANTAPKHANVFLYNIGLDGHCNVQIALPVTVLGAGANPLLACQPFQYCTAGSLDVNSTAMFKDFVGNVQTEYFPYLNDPYISFSVGKGTTLSLTNADMTAGSQLFTLFRFPIRSNHLAGGSI